MSGASEMTVDWWGPLPERWGLAPAKALFSERRMASLPDDEHLTPSQKYGVVTQSQYMESTGSRVVLNLSGADNMKRVLPDDFVIHLRSFQGGIEWSGIPGKVSIAYTVLTPRESADPGYYRWVLKSEKYIQALRVTVNQLRDGQSIKYQDFAKIPLPLPDEQEQRAIADFLDRETTKIDALIEKQTDLIEMLRLRRVETISTAVRRGIDPNVPMSDSGIPWVGEIPDHWSLPQLRRITTTRAGAGFPVEEQGLQDEQFPFYKVNALGRAESDGVIRERYDTVSRKTAARLRAPIVPAGTLVMAKIGAALMLGRIRILSVDSCIDNNMLAVTPRAELHTRFMYYALQDLKMELLVNPGAVPSLSDRSMRAYYLPLPPRQEQVDIASHLDRETAKIDALIAKAEEFIEVARERRSALITAAVTGQIDVQGRAS